MSKTCLPDIQCTEPSIKIPIKQVGVENIELPFLLETKYGSFHQMFANVSLRTSLDENVKGISMSRLLLTLRPYLDLPLKSKLIKKILEELIKNLSENDIKPSAAYITFDFKLPIKRKSPLSKNEFPIYYKCRFEGQLYLIHDESMIDPVPDELYFRFFQGITIQYASYCPCSAELCGDLEKKGSKGFPHNQRSFANIIVETNPNKYIWLEDIIEATESVLPTVPYPIIKRVDEQEIARIAAENPMFVEDSIRAISNSVNEIDGVIDWIIKCSHEESIHTSEAIAINWKGIPGGFDGRRFI